MTGRNAFTLAMLAVLIAAPAQAQDKGSVDAKPLPPLANPNDPKNPAKELFGRKLAPADMQARSIGFYTRDDDWDWEDRKRAQQVFDYYRVPPYWM